MKKRNIVIVISLLLIVLIGVGKYIDYRLDNRDYIYKVLEDGTLELSLYQGEETIVNIPEEVWGKKVTQIGIACFCNRDLYSDVEGLTVDIPETVTVIGGGAFRGRKDLTITGGENVEEIGVSAFSNCTFLTEFPFSKKLRVIGDFAFHATNVKQVTYTDSLEHIGHCAFWLSSLEELDIPENILYVGSGAFWDTPWMDAAEQNGNGNVIVRNDMLIQFLAEETVIIPEGVRIVSQTSHEDSDRIQEIYLSETVEIVMGSLVYERETPLTIYIPESVVEIQPEHPDEGNRLVYEGMEYVTLVVEKGSYGETYAKEMAEAYGCKYEVVEEIKYP